MTMDILWAISHPLRNPSGVLSNSMFSDAAASVGTFAVLTLPYADGSWDMYEDFVGGVQFWGYRLVSGSGDGAVRMWDSESIPIGIPRHLRLNGFAQCRQARRTGPCSGTARQ
jgi:hypothetical protein